MLIGGKTHTAQQGQSQARVGCAARSRQGSVEWVSEQCKFGGLPYRI